AGAHGAHAALLRAPHAARRARARAVARRARRRAAPAVRSRTRRRRAAQGAGMTPDRIERALREVTREARTEQLPKVDWAAIEDELPMTRVHTLPPRPVNFRPWLIAASFALAGGVGLYAAMLVRPHVAPVATTRVSTPVAPSPNLGTTSQDVNGDLLAVGAHV